MSTCLKRNCRKELTRVNTASATLSTSLGTSVSPRSPTTERTVTVSRASSSLVSADWRRPDPASDISWTTAFHRAWRPASKALMALDRRSWHTFSPILVRFWVGMSCWKLKWSSITSQSTPKLNCSNWTKTKMKPAVFTNQTHHNYSHIISIYEYNHIS